VTGLLERFTAYRMPPRVRLLTTVALAVVAGAAIVVPSILTALDGLFPPVDYDTFGPPGAAILTGRWHEVFGDPVLQAGPFELIVFGIPYLLGVEGTLGWAVFSVTLGLLMTAAIALVAYRLVRPASPDLAAPIAAGAAAIATLSATVFATILAGHPAQVVIPLLWVIAALLARRGWSVAAGAVLASTLGWELWGALGAPVLLLAARLTWKTVALTAAGALAAVAVIFGPFLLAGPVTMFGFAWPVSTSSLIHLLWPEVTAFGWPLRLAQAALAVGAGTAVALVLRRRRDAVWLVPLAVCASRLLTDPILVGYYFRAPALLCIIGLALAVALRSPVRIIAALVLLNLALDLTALGWPAPALLLAATVVTVVLVARRPDPIPG
jgi:hypothetical protein